MIVIQGARRAIAPFDPFADRVLPRPVMAGQRFADDGDLAELRVLVGGERSARLQRNAQRAEVVAEGPRHNDRGE